MLGQKMTAFLSLIGSAALFAALMIPGFVLGKRKRFEGTAVPSVSDLLSDVAMPALVLDKLLELRPGDLTGTDLALCVCFPFFTVLAVLGAVTLLRRSRRGGPEFAPDRFCAVFPNCGFLGIPLACALFPEEPRVAVCVCVANVVNSFLLLTLGLYLFSGDKKKISPLRALCSPMTLAIALGTVLSVNGWAERLPWVGEYAGYLAALTTPLSMTVLGYELSGVKLSDFFRTRGLFTVAGCRLLLSPLLTVGLLLGLRALGVAVEPQTAAGLLIATGVSTAASAPALARRYGADGQRTAVLTLATTLCCTLTVPPLLMLTQTLFGT